MGERELKTWAEAHAPAGCTVAKAVLKILETLARRGEILTGLAERVASQSDILTANSEKGGSKGEE